MCFFSSSEFRMQMCRICINIFTIFLSFWSLLFAFLFVVIVVKAVCETDKMRERMCVVL